MDAIVVGALTSVAAVVAVLFWQLLVRPESVLALWHETAATDEVFAEPHPGAVRALRFASASIIFLMGVLTGLALTFLSGTAS